jgi:hypothetical protein
MSAHRPLDTTKNEIRLLRVLPGEFFSPILCELFHTSLDNKPPYRTLSYVWGDASVQKPIRVNGIEALVTVNLEQALRRLRAHHADEPLTIWVDAVCIDQDNMQEREAQVAIMGLIYSSCLNVCVWLGSFGCEDIPDCLSEENALSAEFKQDTRLLFSTPDPPVAFLAEQLGQSLIPGVMSEKFKDFMIPDITLCAYLFAELACGTHLHDIAPFSAWCCESGTTVRSLYASIEALSSSEWFSRSWVVQEASLSPSSQIYFATAVFSPTTLEAAQATTLKTERFCIQCRERMASSERREFWRRLNDFFSPLRAYHGTQSRSQADEKRDFSLIELSVGFRTLNCAVDLDRVYAFIGLATDWYGGTRLRPEYALAPPDLYFGVCKDAVLNGESLQFLAWGLGKNRYPDLPSWVLDWTFSPPSPMFGNMAQRSWIHGTKSWEASRGLRLDAYVIDRLLVSRALHVDRITRFGALWTSDLGFRDPIICARWHLVAGLNTNPDRLYPNGKTWREAWWRSLAFDSFNEWTDHALHAFEYFHVNRPESYLNFDTTLSKGCSREFGDGNVSMDKASRDSTGAYSAMVSKLPGRRLFLTEKGYMGFSEGGVEVGDAVYLLPGCSMPLILRETGSHVTSGAVCGGQPLQDRAVNTLVGAVYIYGAMNGELVESVSQEALGLVCIA